MSRSLTVTLTDLRGIRHVAEVNADSLFEAAVLALNIRRGDRDRHAGSLLVWWRPRLRVLLRPHSVVNRCVRHLSSASNQRPASALITRCSSAQRRPSGYGGTGSGRC